MKKQYLNKQYLNVSDGSSLYKEQIYLKEKKKGKILLTAVKDGN